MVIVVLKNWNWGLGYYFYSCFGNRESKLVQLYKPRTVDGNSHTEEVLFRLLPTFTVNAVVGNLWATTCGVVLLTIGSKLVYLYKPGR